MGSLANSEDTDECDISSGSTMFAKTKTIFRERNAFLLEIITCDPSIYTMDHSKCIVSNQKEEFICE